MRRGAKSRPGPHTQMYKIHQERITAEMSPNTIPILEEYYSLLPRAPEQSELRERGKPRFRKKDTENEEGTNNGHLRDEIANLIEQNNGKRLGSRITLPLKFPAYYPPVGTSARPLQIRID